MDFNKFTIIAGPCLIENREMLRECAEYLCEATSKLDVNFIFKASYRKANRTSSGSFSGIGDEIALQYLREIKNEFSIPVTTDVHTSAEAVRAGEFVDVIQIPAFLSRQTELIEAAAKTGKYVNIKKAQFMAPEDAIKAAQKAADAGNDKILLTERGTCFGYHDLVVDFRSLLAMKESRYPVIYDATHSLQHPSQGIESGGERKYSLKMAVAAVSLGIDGIFFETHPDPAKAKSDSATQIKLSDAGNFIEKIYEMHLFLGELYGKID